MRRGDVYLVDLNPNQGAEADKIRPVVIVSNGAANRVVERTRRGVVTVIPLTSSTSRVFPFQVLVPAGEGGLRSASKAQAEQIRSVDISRLKGRIGTLSPARLAEVDAAIRVHLEL
jgi:mRNA interferase MazF